MDSPGLFESGQGPAVRLPEGYRFDGDEVRVTGLRGASLAGVAFLS